jgi:glycosyltransferase involved in cell wall biosynthesis
MTRSIVTPSTLPAVDRRADRIYWRSRNRQYHEWVERHIASIVTPDSDVLDLHCEAGDLLNRVRPSVGLGITQDPRLAAIARQRYPELAFEVANPEKIKVERSYDYILLPDLVGEISDLWAFLRRIHDQSGPDTRVVMTFYNFLWEPVLKAAELLGLKCPQPNLNWLGKDDVTNLLSVCNFEVEQLNVGLLFPKAVPIVEPLANDVLVNLGPMRHLALVHSVVARPRPLPEPEALSCSVIVPCRNELGNIADAVERMPDMGTHTEVIFVDGASTDGTREAIQEQISLNPTKDIKLIDQVVAPSPEVQTTTNRKVTMLAAGKGDAVRKGFAAASGDVLMILDADLTVPPEDLPRFYLALAEGKGGFINGSRLVYPMENEAMRIVNLFGNKFFSLVFTWLLGQRIKDTLCGTKVLRRSDYERIAAARKEFGEFDPFGDFDLLFGATRIKLPLVEMPVRYRARVAGHTKVQPFKHGILLLEMCLIGFQQLKLRTWKRRLSRTLGLG